MFSRPWFWPLLIFAAAFSLRLIGIGWGLKNDLHNQSYHPDEFVNWAMSQRIKPAEGKFTSEAYNYPTLYLTMLRVASNVVAAYGGAPKSNDDDSVWTYVSRCHLAGRLLNAVAGSLTAVFCFLILRRFTNLFGAGMGAALIAFAPAHAVHSRFQTVDVMSVMLVAACLLFVSRLFDKPLETRKAVQAVLWAGALGGLAAGTKYTSGLVVLALVGALILVKPAGWPRMAGLGFAVCAAAFIVSTPGVLLDFERFWRDFTYEMVHTSTGHGLSFAGYPSGFYFQLVNLMTGIGTLMVLLSLGGLFVAATRKQSWLLTMLFFAVPYYILIGRAEVMFMRYTFPLYPVIASAFGLMMGYAHEQKGRLLFVSLAGILGVGGAEPSAGLRTSLIMSSWMAGEDPRDSAVRALRKEMKPGAIVGIARDPWYWTPPFYKNTALGPANASVQQRFQYLAESNNPKVAFYLPPNIDERYDWDTRLLTEIKPDYVSFTSIEAYDVTRLQAVQNLEPIVQLQVDRARKFFEVVRQDYEPAIVFGGGGPPLDDMAYIRPQVEIWKRKAKP